MSGKVAGFLLLLMATAAWGQSLPDSLEVVPRDMDGDNDGALAELEAAGSPLTQGEIADLRQKSAEGRRGQILWRKSLQPDGALPGTIKIEGEARGLRLRVRRSRTGSLADPWRFSIRRQGNHSDLLAGGVAESHGFGLLSGRPGRGGTLAADQALGWTGQGLRTWPYVPTGSAVIGCAGAVNRQAWTLEGMTGRYLLGEPDAQGLCRMLRLCRRSRLGTGQLSLLAVGFGGKSGISLAGRRRGGILDLEFELALVRSQGTEVSPRAMMARLKYAAAHTWQLEAIAGWNEGGQLTPFAAKPPVFSGWGGGGWAVRITTRPAGTTTLKILVADARYGDPVSAGAKRRGILDFLWEWSPHPGWHGSLRWRRQRNDVGTWSSQYPWLPPSAGYPGLVTSVVAALARRFSSGGFQVALRSREAVADAGGKARYLVASKGNWQPWESWTFRGEWDMAWGDDADLVSALNPLQGYVVPRHWGKWQGQWMIGLGRELGVWRFQAGMAGRDPASISADKKRDMEGWVDVALNW